MNNHPIVQTTTTSQVVGSWSWDVERYADGLNSAMTNLHRGSVPVPGTHYRVVVVIAHGP